MQACGLKSLMSYFNVKTCYMRRECDNKEGDLNRAHPIHRVLGYKRGSDITDVRVYVYNRMYYEVNQ